jgi:hypothetical protein
VQHFEAYFYNILILANQSVTNQKQKNFKKSTKKGAKTPLKISQNVAFVRKSEL